MKHIANKEKINISDESIYAIQKMFHSDIRSMINFIQLHQHDTELKTLLVTDVMWEELHELFKKESMSPFIECSDKQTKNGEIRAFSNTAIFSSEVVEPKTLYPF